MKYKFNLPVSQSDLEKLRAGDRVILSGVIYTARDAAHKRLTELMAAGETCRLDLKVLRFIMRDPLPRNREKLSALPAPPLPVEWTPMPPSFWMPV